MINAGVIAVMVWAAITVVEAKQRQPVYVTCDKIRAAVAEYGVEAVEQFAREHGVLERDLRRARKCLRGN